VSLRPVPASWFELLVLREDLTVAIDVLAQSSRIELQSHGESSATLLMPECRELLGEFDELEQRYRRYWPTPRRHEPDEHLEPHRTLVGALQRLRAWARDAHDLVARIESLGGERSDLGIVRSLLVDARPLPDLALFGNAGPMLAASVFLLSGDGWPESLPGSVIARRAVTPEHEFLFAVGLPTDIAALERQLGMQKARKVELPADLPGETDDAVTAVGGRIAGIEAEIEAIQERLQSLHEQHDLADAIADSEFVRWYVDTVPDLVSTENFAWITGWTSDTSGEPLLRCLADADVKGLLRLQPAPPGFEPPLILRNPRWLRPFEVFSGMLGVPSADEVDPTRVVAVAAPLIFGYMFGDVGHGAVLTLAGFVLSRRMPALRLLISGGLASIVFGFLFGSVFAREDIIRPIWLHPLEHPVTILLLPLAGGAVLLLLGMFLDALQAYWRQEGRRWLETGAGLVLTYLSLIGALFEPYFLWAALAGTLWFVLGHGLAPEDGKRLAAIGAAAMELAELVLQLVVNTISFVRVGAFSLAHGGLSVAVVGVAAVSGSTAVQLLLLAIGNIVIIGLEGLIVGIQTTRLVLFEFFVRFLRAEGRPFKPISPRVPHASGNHRRPS
jgi:V/A-type H+-transporting ATPase subunit I